ncbi:MAG TPA: hypothetical protein VGN52_01695 [Burkholderiales bacterium]|jgi:hypothetical protein
MDTLNPASTDGLRAGATSEGASPDPAFSMFVPPDTLSPHGAPAAPPVPEAPQPIARTMAPIDPVAQATPTPLDPETQKLVDRALFKVKAMVFGCLALAIGVMVLLLTVDFLQPLRQLLGKRHADELGWRIEWGIFGSLILWMLFMWLAAQIVRRLGCKERERTLREGIAQAIETARRFQETLLEDLRQAGASEEALAEMRATFEETRRKNLAQSEARIKDWAKHPEHMQAEIDRFLAEATARRAAKDGSAPGNPA